MMPTIFYEVRSRDGTVAAIHKRTDRPDGGKDIIWLRPEGAVGLNGTPTSELPLFGIDVIGDDDQVVIVEGEKAALALQGLGIPAVGTVTGASGMPSTAVLLDLAGRIVRLWPDNDGPGRKHMQRIAEALDDIAVVALVEWPEAPDRGDAADFVIGRNADDVRALLATATPFEQTPDREGSEISEGSPG
jgi:5S rRNA maturation endonuclease (ribonuclease M5)